MSRRRPKTEVKIVGRRTDIRHDMQRNYARKASDHDDHYQAVAKVYSMAVFYDSTGPFVKWLKQRLSEVMR